MDVEDCGAGVSEVAVRRRCNAAVLSSRVSAAVFSPPFPVGVAQAWSHCWTYFLEEGDGMGQDNTCTCTCGGSTGTRYE